jgi:hypothetical protein
MNKILIGIDYSCNKPACCILKDNHFYFCIWPLDFDDNTIKKLEESDIYVDSRDRLSLGTDSSEKFRYHISMSKVLNTKITNYFKKIIGDRKVYFAFEGSSFGSKGDAALQLAGYRYVLVNELSKIYGIKNIFTYSPMTIKSVANCATKDKKGKTSMITTFSEENINHKFNLTLKTNPQFLKKKTNFVSGIDDLVDSYFTLKTLQLKEETV